MAETVHLTFKAGGTAIEGESTQTSLGREKTIECLYLQQSIFTQREGGSGMATGRRTHEALEFLTRIEKSTPLLIKALCQNTVCEAEFKFYRPNPTGDGTTEQYYTIKCTGARLSKVNYWSPNVLQPTATPEPPQVKFQLVFHTISWTYTNGGVQHEDTWSGQS